MLNTKTSRENAMGLDLFHQMNFSSDQKKNTIQSLWRLKSLA
uniref:Uncharacterized protein n=1 Tax=Rhizophora mucronata TaxID=61149 RepID=A0A2P2ITG5_RHIMU